MGLLSELRRRNVDRMAVMYVVAAWLIMQVAEVLISLRVLPLSIGPATFTILAIGFPISLIIAWYFEITPEGVKREKDINRAESITHITGRRMDFIFISLLSAAVLLFAYDKWWIGPPPEKSIAVMAFENMSADPEQEYFSDGISEELLNLLAQIPELTVISRSSTFSFKGKDVAVPEIAKQLNVAHVLEGSVRKVGNRVRITAQLIEARSDSHLWSESYDRELRDIFAVQGEIAAAISDALKLELTTAPGKSALPTAISAANTEAHDAYLRGRHLVAQDLLTSFEAGIREFKKAIALDPDYALAHADLAAAILRMSRRFGNVTEAEAFARAAPHVERAMVLAPSLAEVQFATGWLWWRKDPEKALAHYEQAIRINPNYAAAYAAIGNVLWVDFGRYADSIAAVEAEVRLNPLSIAGRDNYALILFFRNRIDKAYREAEKLASISPARYQVVRGLIESHGGKWADDVHGHLSSLRVDLVNRASTWRALGVTLAAIGLEKEALALSARGALSPFALRMLGRSGDAVTAAEARLAEDPTDTGKRRDLGFALASAGDYERARPILEEMWALGDKRVTKGNWITKRGAAALTVIRRDAGELDGADELLAAIRDDLRRMREAGFSTASHISHTVDFYEGLAAYLAGEREKGLALIAKGADDGYFIHPNDAYLQALYDDPGFAPIRAAQEARQTRERERFLAIVCVDNPYASFWQPAEGTCEQFAAAQ